MHRNLLALFTGVEIDGDNDKEVRIALTLGCCDREAVGYFGFRGIIVADQSSLKSRRLGHYSRVHPHRSLGARSPENLSSVQ
jgi:hypothetical protein